MSALTAAELAAWRCDLTDPLTWRLKVLAWLWTIGAPLHDDAHRGVAAVHLERHGDATTVVVNRRTPPGVKPIYERWPMTVEPPARPSQEDRP